MIINQNEISARFLPVHEMFEEFEARLMEQIEDEASSGGGDVDWIMSLAQRVTKLRTFKKEYLPAIESFAEETLNGYLSPDEDITLRNESGLRLFDVSVSSGMLNQSLFTLTQARKQGLVEIGEEFEVTLPDGKVFSTTLVEPGNRFRERSMIKHFYKLTKVREDDKVRIAETAPGKWKLTCPTAREQNETLMKLLSLEKGIEIDEEAK